MAIHFIYGAPGSGKSYYSVYHLVHEFYDYNEDLGTYVIKEKYQEYRVVTNVECLKVPHDNLDEWILKAGGVEKFFSLAFQRELFEKKNLKLIYLIDECHMYFPDNFRCNEVFDYFSYHRHFGTTIYLISQSLYNVPRRIVNLCELVLYALPASTSLLGGKDLKYNVISGREKVDSKILIKKKKIFELYKSQDADEAKKTKNPLIKYLVAVFLFFIASVAVAANTVLNFGKDTAKNVSAVSEVQFDSSSESSSAATSLSSRLKQAPSDPIEMVRVSCVQDSMSGMIIFFGNTMIHYKDFPYEIVEGPYRIMYAKVPRSEMVLYFPDFDIKEKSDSDALQSAGDGARAQVGKGVRG